jgi:hypothetical protein
VNAETAEILEKAKALPAEELRALCAELLRQAAQSTASRPETTGRPGKLWDAEEMRAWSKKTWGDRYFSPEEVQQMKDAEDGLID